MAVARGRIASTPLDGVHHMGAGAAAPGMAAETSSSEVDDRSRCDLEWWILGSHSDMLVVALLVFEYQIIDLLYVFLHDRSADVFRSFHRRSPRIGAWSQWISRLD